MGYTAQPEGRTSHNVSCCVRRDGRIRVGSFVDHPQQFPKVEILCSPAVRERSPQTEGTIRCRIMQAQSVLRIER